MKFHELEEGKTYRRMYNNNKSIDGIFYQKKDQILHLVHMGGVLDPSAMTSHDVKVSNFEEVIEYVTFEEAVEHMKNGGSAKFVYSDYNKTVKLTTTTLPESSGNRTYIIYSDTRCYANFLVEWTKPKWQLL